MLGPPFFPKQKRRRQMARLFWTGRYVVVVYGNTNVRPVGILSELNPLAARILSTALGSP